MFKHSMESGHRKIDSLTENCYTCKQEFENFIALMKHRKSAHYSIISESVQTSTESRRAQKSGALVKLRAIPENED